MNDYPKINNASYCFDCDTLIVSFHRHDFRHCECGNISVDGGMDYIRRSAINDNWADFFDIIKDYKKAHAK